MSEIEALLKVDGGQVPPGAVAFFLGDVDATERRTYAALAVLAAVAAAACVGLGAGRFVVMLLVLAGTALALLAMPTARESHEQAAVKRPVIVVTPHALVMRDEWGLRVWRFEDLTSVSAAVHEQRPQLVLVCRDGKRHLVDCLRFRHGERVREVVDQRLRSLGTQIG
jgi:hypothetical protein